MSESTQKTKKIPHWVLELFTFIFIPYLIVYISSPVIFGILLFIGIPIFIFLYFRLTNHIINLENPAGHKKLNLPQTPKPKLPSNQKKHKIPFITAILSIFFLPFLSISTYISITVFGTENLDITQNFLNEIPQQYIIIALMAIVIPGIYISIIILSLGCIPVHKDSSTEEQNNQTEKSIPPKNKTLVSIFSKHSKILFSLSTILAIVAYASVLRSNLVPAGGDIGMALQITSLQFSENKFKWIAQLSIFATLLYLTATPALLTWEAKEYIDSNSSYPIIKSIDTSNPVSLCKALIYLSILSTLVANICNSTLILPTMKNGVGVFLLLLPFMSLLFCSLSITLTINKNFLFPSPQKDNPEDDKFERRLYIFIGLVTLFALVYIAPKIFLEYLPNNLGRSISSPGETLGSSGIVYDCVFSNDPKSRESTAFGIIAASKPESVHIFTPEYNREKNSYGEEAENGKVNLNKLAESQVKIPGGYHIEKFDGFKHRYNLRTGKCEYVQTRYSLKEIFYKEYIENSKKPPHK